MVPLTSEAPGIDLTHLSTTFSVSVDGVAGEMGLLARVGPDSEVHFLPAIAGGGARCGTH